MLAAMAMLALISCGGDDDSHSDINDDNIDVDMTPWTLLANYDGFPNVAIRCDGVNRLYATTRLDNPLIVVPNSPNCQPEDR